MSKKKLLISTVVVCALTVGALSLYGHRIWVPIDVAMAGKRTVSDVLSTYGDKARTRMALYFANANAAYPPKKVTFLAVKDTGSFEVWVGSDTSPIFIRTYDIKALSGISGPKLREGDFQVPEGFYEISGLNPNSSYHLSMKINFPNAFDLTHAQTEGRTSPGSNIFIHGKAASIGCLAMGDEAIEELFTLVADIGKRNVRVVIAPSDPRVASLQVPSSPAWVSGLYARLTNEFSKYRKSDI